MADNLAQDLELPEREDLYTKFNEVGASIKPEEQKRPKPQNRFADGSAEGNVEQASAGQLSEFGDGEFFANSESSDEINTEAGGNGLTFRPLFQKLPLLQRVWYYLLSIFTRKPAEALFTQTQLNGVRHGIAQLNNELIMFDRDEKIYLVSSYLPERFNTIFKKSLEVLPIINQVDRNLKFMQDIVTKLIFNTYKNNSGNAIRIDAEFFISQEDLRSYIFMGDAATHSKIDDLMQEVNKNSKSLPVSMYKYAAQMFKALYQFQKICYFPYSNFFQAFRTTSNKGNKSVYTNILPQESYDSINILYQLIKEVGSIELDTTQFRDIISSYFNVVDRKGASNPHNQTAVQFLESFVRLQTFWNNFIQKVPIGQLLLFVAENPYLELPAIQGIDDAILEDMPRQIAKVYQQTARENIEAMGSKLRETLNKHYFHKYLSSGKFQQSPFYNTLRSDLMPGKLSKEIQEKGPFAHCISFSYIRNFLENFCAENILTPLSILSKGVFESDNLTYNTIVEFLEQLENLRVKLEVIEQNLEPGHRLDTEIKEVILLIEQRLEKANDEYATLMMNIDREVRVLIDQIIKRLQDFSSHSIPAIEQAILDQGYHQKFTSFIPHFDFMNDYDNPKYAPLTPDKILELWRQYIAEFTLLLRDQLELERQDILGQMSKIANIRRHHKYSSNKSA